MHHEMCCSTNVICRYEHTKFMMTVLLKSKGFNKQIQPGQLNHMVGKTRYMRVVVLSSIVIGNKVRKSSKCELDLRGWKNRTEFFKKNTMGLEAQTQRTTKRKRSEGNCPEKQKRKNLKAFPH